MRRLHLSFIVFCVLASCDSERDYNPETHMSAQQQEAFMSGILRYMSRAPEGVAPEDRLNPAHDAHYAEQRGSHRLDALYKKGDTYFFMVSRPAPSLTEKRIAIGGKATLNDKMRLDYYEEIFRTWKMEPDTLSRRGLFLFDRMTKEKDLTPYYASHSGNTDYIEFPDERTYFDVRQRIWRSK